MRLATPADVVRLSAFATQVFLHTYATDGVNDNLAEYVRDAFAPDAFRALIDDSARAILVEELGDALVGFAELAFDTPCPDDPSVTTEIATLYVSEHHARRGIGTRLLAAGMDLARSRSEHGDLWLSVYAGNPEALAFYAARGFERLGTLWFELGTGTHENHVLVLRG